VRGLPFVIVVDDLILKDENVMKSLLDNILIKISPAWIHRFYELHFFFSEEVFQFFFSCDRIVYILSGFVVDESMTAIFLGEAFYQALLMLVNSTDYVIGHTYIEYSGLACEDVDIK
jgi:hypothetical protein